MNGRNKLYGLLAIVLSALVFFGGAVYGTHNPVSFPSATTLENIAANNISVHITGAVANDGVFELPAASRLEDILQMAGVLDNADLSDINLSQFLEDGKKIEIPFTESDAAKDNKTNKLININTASHEELDSLPGIGKVKADSIINYRENNGPFKKPADIMKVSGIGEATYEKLKDMICVD